MSDRPSERRLVAMAAWTIIAGLGVCAMAVAVMATSMLGRVGAWPVFGVGFVAVVGSLAALWRIESQRDRCVRLASPKRQAPSGQVHRAKRG